MEALFACLALLSFFDAFTVPRFILIDISSVPQALSQLNRDYFYRSHSMSHIHALEQYLLTSLFLLDLSIGGSAHFSGGKSQEIGICPNSGKEIKWLFFGLASLFFPQVNIDQAEPRGIANQFYGAVQVEFIHDVGPVVLDGFGADEKSFSNLFC